MKFRGIKETCIYISDIDQSYHFYNEFLGLPVVTQAAGRHIFFRVGSDMLLCFVAKATLEGGDLPPHGAKGSVHYGLEVQKEDYDAWKAHFSDHDYEIEQEAEWKGLKSFYFRDPDGNLGEIMMEGIWSS